MSKILALCGNIPGSLLIWGLLLCLIPHAWVFAVSAVIGFGLYKYAKKITARPRPYERHERISPRIKPPDPHSFPSGHTCNATLMALCWSTLGFWGALLGVVFIVLMGVSRVVLGMHYPSDVLAGFALGFILSGWSLALLSVFG